MLYVLKAVYSWTAGVCWKGSVLSSTKIILRRIRSPKCGDEIRDQNTQDRYKTKIRFKTRISKKYKNTRKKNSHSQFNLKLVAASKIRDFLNFVVN